MRERLRRQGVNLSLSTLSYWQSGRSQPERAASMRAVDALEGILELPSGTLRSQLGPQKPRGRALSSYNPAASWDVLTEDSPIMCALAEEFTQLNQEIRELVSDVTVRIDASRCLRFISTREVVRAVRDGVTSMTSLYTHEEATGPPEIRVRFGALGEIRYLPQLRTTVVEILFGRPLARNETALIEHEVHFPRGDNSTLYQNNTRAGMQESLLQVIFSPKALPSACHRFHRKADDDEGEVRTQRTHIDASHSAHLLITRCAAGAHGISWEWPS